MPEKRLISPPAYESTMLSVKPEWIDYNGHMNVAYYMVAFDLGVDQLMDSVGLGQAYRAAKDCSTFALESHITYESEMLVDDPIRVRSVFLESDKKRFVYYMEMTHGETGILVATLLQLSIHMDLRARRTALMPPDIQANITRMRQAQSVLARPSRVGRVIQLYSKRPGR